MITRRTTRIVHEGQYVAEVEMTIPNEGWSPYLSLDDALKLDDVRQALRDGDVKRASLRARVFKLTSAPCNSCECHPGGDLPAAPRPAQTSTASANPASTTSAAAL
jgi:hypothetical protein